VIENYIPFIMTSAPQEPMKVWDFKGSHIRDIGGSDYTYYIDVWYDKDKVYIINANLECIKLFDYYTGEVVKSFNGAIQTWHKSASVHYISNKPYLFGTNGDGQLRIWDLASGKLFKDF
jgi:WD40 repeat protein